MPVRKRRVLDHEPLRPLAAEKSLQPRPKAPLVREAPHGGRVRARNIHARARKRRKRVQAGAAQPRERKRLFVAQEGVRRLMVVPAEENLQQVRSALKKADPTDMFVTLFAMQPLTGGPFRSEILGYSIMSALGIRGEELG